jgi:N-acyl-D-aspartate/D-glutamate deacylase
MNAAPRAIVCAFLVLCAVAARAQTYDIVIANGRVIDPQTQLDATRHVGISMGEIRAVSESALEGATIIDAKGLVVAPGFIDLHWHGMLPESGVYEAMDGVTTSLELEVGTADVDAWYADREGRYVVNFGVAVGHLPVRMQLMGDTGAFLPKGPGAKRRATDKDIEELKGHIEHGLRRGAVAVGFGVAYTPAASYWEIIELFRVAAKHNAITHVHIRGASSASATGADREQGLMEVIAAGAVSGAPVHVAHIQSSGQASTPRMLDIITEARTHGVDVSTECYPYTAGMTRIESFLFDDWDDKPESEFQKLQWAATGERLTKESFMRHRREGGLVIIHANTEDIIRVAVAHPLTMIASDGFDIVNGRGHPRSAGTFTRILGRYVREAKLLTLMDALRKMTLAPAQRLEARVPAMRRKGRLQPGADADIAIFDADRVIDKATFEAPGTFAEGVAHVLVNGQFVVRDGKPVPNATPGKPVRAPLE